MVCAACRNPAAHPETGTQWSETCLICKNCSDEFWAWYAKNARRTVRIAKKKKGEKKQRRVSFYRAAATSIKPEHGDDT